MRNISAIDLEILRGGMKDVMPNCPLLTAWPATVKVQNIQSKYGTVFCGSTLCHHLIPEGMEHVPLPCGTEPEEQPTEDHGSTSGHGNPCQPPQHPDASNTFIDLPLSREAPPSLSHVTEKMLLAEAVAI